MECHRFTHAQGSRIQILLLRQASKELGKRPIALRTAEVGFESIDLLWILGEFLHVLVEEDQRVKLTLR